MLYRSERVKHTRVGGEWQLRAVGDDTGQASRAEVEGSASSVLAGSDRVPGCGGGCLLASEGTASGADAQCSNACAEQVATVERLCRMYVNGFFVADLANLCRLLDILAGPHTGMS